MILYLTQVLFYSTVLFLGYRLLIKNTKFFKARRIILLLLSVFSLIVPFAKNIIPQQSKTISEVFYLNEVNITNISKVGDNIDKTISLNMFDYILMIYLLVAFILAVIFLVKLWKVLILKRTAIKENNIYYTQKEHSPFSFFNSIFISESQKNRKENEVIIIHENAHISQYHSLDILFFEILNILFWYNPIFHSMKKEMAVVHEYLADESVLKTGVELKDYSDILLRFLYLKPMAIANNLNNSLIKNRFIMMTQSQNKKGLIFRLSSIMTLVILVFVFNNCINQNDTNTENNDADSTLEQAKTEAQKNDTTVQFADIEIKPKFEGGQDSLLRYIAYSTKYPEIAKAADVEGTLFIKFVIAKDGNITKVDTIRATTEFDKTSEEFMALQKEAIRVISDMPKWTPGSIDGENVNVQYVVPIKFQLQ